MASKADTYNRKNPHDTSALDHNHTIALTQGEKNTFRAHKIALGADKYNPARLSNAIDGNLVDN
jgi:hypothetical protein